MMADKNNSPVLIIFDERSTMPLEVLIDRDSLTIGRDDDCDVVLPVRAISRQHIRVYRQDDGYFVEDLGSLNGTQLNQEKLNGTHPLKNEDKIILADAVTIEFVASNETLKLRKVVSANVGKLRLDRDARRAYVNNVEIDPPLSPPQYRLLELLYTNPGRICSREEVVNYVWPEAHGEGVSEQAIDALVRRLRDRIHDIDDSAEYVITVRGHGFRLHNG
jgi:pSer/pThr/pTyr-binding forkhead associated (FHA) protein